MIFNDFSSSLTPSRLHGLLASSTSGAGSQGRHARRLQELQGLPLERQASAALKLLNMQKVSLN